MAPDGKMRVDGVDDGRSAENDGKYQDQAEFLSLKAAIKLEKALHNIWRLLHGGVYKIGH